MKTQKGKTTGSGEGTRRKRKPRLRWPTHAEFARKRKRKRRPLSSRSLIRATRLCVVLLARSPPEFNASHGIFVTRLPILSAPPPPDADRILNRPSGPLVMPGTYKVSIAKRVDGVLTPLGQPQEFQVMVEGQENMSTADRSALVEFQQKAVRLQRAVSGATQAANALKPRLAAIKRAITGNTFAAAKASKMKRRPGKTNKRDHSRVEWRQCCASTKHEYSAFDK